MGLGHFYFYEEVLYMTVYKTNKSQQLELLEGGSDMKHQSAMRVNIVSLKLVKESSLL
jgi:hypothetical protein